MSELVRELQLLEHSIQTVASQKQTFEAELAEVTNAKEEVSKTSDAVFKVVGSIMVKSDKHTVISDLEERQRLLETRIEKFVKQEESLQNRSAELRNELKKSVGK